LEGEPTGVTIQPITSANAYSTGPTSTKSTPAASSTEKTPQDTVQLSAQAQASIDKDHDGDSH
jgi:hypothetical protein